MTAIETLTTTSEKLNLGEVESDFSAFVQLISVWSNYKSLNFRGIQRIQHPQYFTRPAAIPGVGRAECYKEFSRLAVKCFKKTRKIKNEKKVLNKKLYLMERSSVRYLCATAGPILLALTKTPQSRAPMLWSKLLISKHFLDTPIFFPLVCCLCSSFPSHKSSFFFF